MGTRALGKTRAAKKETCGEGTVQESDGAMKNHKVNLFATKRRNGIGAKINAAFAKDDWQGARKLIAKELETDPENHWLLDRLSSAYYEEKNYRKALELIEKAHRIDPDCPLVLWDLAGTIFTMGNTRGALRIYQSLIAKGPEEIAEGHHGEGMDWAIGLLVDCFFRVGICYQKLSRKGTAEKFLQRFMDLRAKWNGGIHTLEEAASRIAQISNPNKRDMARQLTEAKELLPT